MSVFDTSAYADPARPLRRSRDPPVQPPAEHLHDIHLLANEGDNALLLSPYSYSQTLSSVTSPPQLVRSHSAEAPSEYNVYPATGLYGEMVEDIFSVPFDATSRLPDDWQTSMGPTTSTFPPSPVHSMTDSPSRELNGSFVAPSIVHHDVNVGLASARDTQPAHSPSMQLTPDHSGSSHTSGEGLEPSIMAPAGQSPAVLVSQWEPNQSPIQVDDLGTTCPFPEIAHDSVPAMTDIERDEDGKWAPNQRTGQAGLDPNSRRLISDVEIPTLKEAEDQRLLQGRNTEVNEWRLQASSSHLDDINDPNSSYFAIKSVPDDQCSLAPVDDAASIRNNRLQEGQTYYSMGNTVLPTPPTHEDYRLMSQARHFNDGPSFPYTTDTRELPPTANDAIKYWNGNADTFSLSSRAATWGTRRRSEPSLKDVDAIIDGSFLKKLSISKPLSRQNSLLDQGLDKLANIVRKRSNSGLKRARNIPQDPNPSPPPPPPSRYPQQRQNSQGSLLTLPRSPSFGRRQTPSINTALVAMSGSLSAVGTTHARSGSVGGLGSSPRSQSPLPGFAGRIIQRARSKSELISQREKSSPSGLVGLLRGHGGPPVPKLAPGQETGHDKNDIDEEEDDEEENDDGDLSTLHDSYPIIPTYEGFKAHVRRLNPDMNASHDWLVSRIAHQQEIRYKNLLEMRVKHSQMLLSASCPAGEYCLASGGSAMLLDARGRAREWQSHSPGTQIAGGASDESLLDGALTDGTFPMGVPMPPVRSLPAELECQLCFKSKKFQKPSDWTKHVHEDVQPFTCTYEKCREPKSFKRKADWVRHENERHRHLEWWVCQMDDCHHPCYRKDNFLQHLVREHKLPEPKQKTKAAIKKARTTEMAWIMLERCHHDTANQPQDEPCKFCGKTFTTWKKLTVHLAKHMECISLPILKLVEQRKVDADTVVSPVDSNVSPTTPIGPRFGSVSPLDMAGHDSTMSSYPAHPQAQFYTPSTGTTFPLQPSVQQAGPFDQTMMFPQDYAGPVSHQPARAFGSMNSSIAAPSQTRTYDHASAAMDYNTHGFAAPSMYPSPNVMDMTEHAYTYTPIPIPASESAYPTLPMTQPSEPPALYTKRNSPGHMPYYNL